MINKILMFQAPRVFVMVDELIEEQPASCYFDYQLLVGTALNGALGGETLSYSPNSSIIGTDKSEQSWFLDVLNDYQEVMVDELRRVLLQQDRWVFHNFILLDNYVLRPKTSSIGIRYRSR